MEKPVSTVKPLRGKKLKSMDFPRDHADLQKQQHPGVYESRDAAVWYSIKKPEVLFGPLPMGDVFSTLKNRKNGCFLHAGVLF